MPVEEDIGNLAASPQIQGLEIVRVVDEVAKAFIRNAAAPRDVEFLQRLAPVFPQCNQRLIRDPVRLSASLFVDGDHARGIQAYVGEHLAAHDERLEPVVGQALAAREVQVGQLLAHALRKCWRRDGRSSQTGKDETSSRTRTRTSPHFGGMAPNDGEH